MQRKKVEAPSAARLLRGLVFAGVTMWFAHSTGGKPEMPLRMISTIVKGDAAMAAGTTSPALGAAVHVMLSALFGMVFALAVPLFRTNGTIALAGTVYGLLQQCRPLDRRRSSSTLPNGPDALAPDSAVDGHVRA